MAEIPTSDATKCDPMPPGMTGCTSPSVQSIAQGMNRSRAGGGVLEEHVFARKQKGQRAVGGQRGFVKAAEDEFFLARVGVDVAHGEDARLAGGEFFGVHHQLLALDGQAPVGNRPQARTHAVKNEQRIQRQAARDAVCARELEGGQAADVACAAFQAGDLADGQLHAALLA